MKVFLLRYFCWNLEYQEHSGTHIWKAWTTDEVRSEALKLECPQKIYKLSPVQSKFTNAKRWMPGSTSTET